MAEAPSLKPTHPYGSHPIEDRYVSDLYRILIENVVDYSVFLIDADGTVLTWNPGSARMFGYNAEEIIGRNVAILFTPEDRAAPAPEQEREGAIANGRSEDERWHLRCDGSLLYVSGIVVPLYEGDRLAALAKIGRDRSKERRLHEELEQANAAKDEFLAIVSHELRTPLTATLGWAQLARYTSLEPETLHTALEAIERTAKLQSELVDDLLDASRIAAGKMSIDRKPVDLVEVLKAATDAVMSLAQNKELVVTTELPEKPVLMLGDENRLQQIFWNLLSNAVKFTPTRGHVRVQLSAEAPWAVLTVTDSGSGISAEFLPYVFDRFRQGGLPESRGFGGLGLGLSIVRHIAEALGGRVQARSAGEGHGAEFRVELPLLTTDALAALDASDTGRTAPRAPAGVTTLPAIGGTRVLLIEDDTETRSMLTNLLVQTGTRSRVAASGTEAIQLFGEEQPDVVVSDIAMPEMSGYDVIAALRRIEAERAWEPTPVIALTALASPEDRARLLSSGFQLHVTKPIDTGELTAAIASVVGRTH